MYIFSKYDVLKLMDIELYNQLFESILQLLLQLQTFIYGMYINSINYCKVFIILYNVECKKNCSDNIIICVAKC